MKKAQQRLYFLHQLRKLNLPQELLKQFYYAIIESVLCMSITVWFSSATKSDLRRLRRVVRTAERIIGTTSPPPHPTLPRTVLIQSDQKGWENHSDDCHDDQRPMGKFGQDTGVTPLLFFSKDILAFFMTTESQHLGLTSYTKDGAFYIIMSLYVNVSLKGTDCHLTYNA